MAIAEPSHPLSMESFSHSWLINLKPSCESLGDSFRAALDASDATSFIDMDPRMPPSKRFLRYVDDFDFDLPFLQQSPPATILHADELFSDGLLKPPFNPSRVEGQSSLGSSPLEHAPRRIASNSKIRRSSLRRCRTLYKQILERQLDFLRPLYHKIKGGKKRVISPAASPRSSTASSISDWRRSCDSESSIYEAVLHCKRSIGK
ncbi:hypothetical protein Ancab_009162 [Ancistrocladus abbreviatus]